MDMALATQHLGPQFGLIAADIDTALAELRLPPGAEVLDVGTGEGKSAITLALHGFRVLTGEPATDTTHYANKDWQSGAAAMGAAPLITFQPFNAAHMPFASGRFAAVVFFGVLHHIAQSERAAVFAEALRVTAPGGAVVFFEPHAETLAKIRVTDPTHPEAANPAEYQGSLRVSETRLAGQRMNMFIYRAA
ncbi:class I SAM-dependent methyltransferase [Acidocella sp.]|uniref:class I SAM-dependent methyltransferase n=1 Tax=Acidocella sp. TaxID=50710 RepID=UPI0026043685|nr:class I SAM-dependent methyltransferase [Acidocella sp.]